MNIPDGSRGPTNGQPAGAADLRCHPEIERGRPVRFLFDGRPIAAYEGETIAAALLAGGQAALRVTSGRGEPRGLVCNMGICFECVVEVDGAPLRACQTRVADGMTVVSQKPTQVGDRAP